MVAIRNILLSVLCAAALTGCTELGMHEIPMAELEQRYAPAPSRFAEIDGVRIHYRDEGSGPVLFLMHGVMASLHTWDGWASELSKHYRVIRIDVPGFGLTGPLPGERYDPAQVQRMIVALWDKLGITRATVIGNSYGGYLAWNLAAKHADRVERVVIVAGKSFPQEIPLLLHAITLPPASWFAPHMAPKLASTILLNQVFADASRISPEAAERYFELQLRPGNRASMLSVLQWAVSDKPEAGQPVPAGLLDIKQPLMTLWGRQDSWIPYETVGKRWQEAYPHAVHKVYDDAGHIPMEEIPERTVSDVVAFLRSTDRR